MSVRLIAMGNTLMGDDAIGIEVAKRIEEGLSELAIEVIYAETDFSYCVSKLSQDDYVFLLDAAKLGRKVGDISLFSLHGALSIKKEGTQHSFSLLEAIQLFHPSIEGIVIAIEVEEIKFFYGLSNAVKEKIEPLSRTILQMIKEKIENGYN